MKVLITTDWFLPTTNGVVTSVINLRNELEKRGHDVRVLTLVQTDKNCSERNTYYIKSFSVGKIYPQARMMRSLATKEVKEIIEWKPDIIHSQCEFSTYLFARHIAKKTNAPIIHTYHTVYEDYTHYFSFSKRVGRQTVKMFTRAILRNTQDVIVPTDKVNKLLHDYHVKQPIYTVPTGIDLDRYAARISKEIIAQKKKELGILEHQFVLIYLGRVAKEKNIEEVVDYVGRVHSQNIRLLIVGDGPDMKALRDYVEEVGADRYVIFTGRVDRDRVNEYYQLGDVFVSASTSETQGLTYIEALASGVPLLCRKDECLDDVIDDGVNGFQYENFEEFSNYLKILDKDGKLDEKYKQSALEKAERFSTQRFGEDVEKIYCKALEEKSEKEKYLLDKKKSFW